MLSDVVIYVGGFFPVREKRCSFFFLQELFLIFFPKLGVFFLDDFFARSGWDLFSHQTLMSEPAVNICNYIITYVFHVFP